MPRGLWLLFGPLHGLFSFKAFLWSALLFAEDAAIVHTPVCECCPLPSSTCEEIVGLA